MRRVWSPSPLFPVLSILFLLSNSSSPRRAAHEPRPLNLDPGYLTPAKLVLASTKDHSHRIYLGQGIYAEVTLYYQGGQWRTREWTFPDYRQPEYHAFFDACRRQLRAGS